MNKKSLVILLLASMLLMTACNKDATSSDTSAIASSDESHISSSAAQSDALSEEESSAPVSEEMSSEAEALHYLDGQRLLVFGDSITALGTWGKTVASNCNMTFFNGAMGGITTAEALYRFDAYVANRDPAIVTLCFGMNDLIMTGPNQPRVTPTQFGENLTTMVNRVRELGAVPVLMTTNILNEAVFYSSQGQDPANYTEVGSPLAWLDVYNDVTRTVAQDTDTALVDMRAACDGHTATELLRSDGIHLGDAGNALFAETLTAYLKSAYENDPNAERVDETANYKVLTSGESAVIASTDVADWFCPQQNTMKITAAGDTLQFTNTNGLWPEAHYALTNPVVVNSDATLTVRLSTANVAASIVLFFNGATPSANSDGEYLSINTLLGVNTNEVNDILPNQTVECVLPLSSLNLPKGAYDADGNIVFSGVKIFVAGNANQPVTLTEISLTQN